VLHRDRKERRKHRRNPRIEVASFISIGLTTLTIQELGLPTSPKIMNDLLSALFLLCGFHAAGGLALGWGLRQIRGRHLNGKTPHLLLFGCGFGLLPLPLGASTFLPGRLQVPNRSGRSDRCSKHPRGGPPRVYRSFCFPSGRHDDPGRAGHLCWRGSHNRKCGPGFPALAAILLVAFSIELMFSRAVVRRSNSLESLSSVLGHAVNIIGFFVVAGLTALVFALMIAVPFFYFFSAMIGNVIEFLFPFVFQLGVVVLAFLTGVALVEPVLLLIPPACSASTIPASGAFEPS
jgi:hypothetical protein